jgi:hypothetical protein
MRLSRQAFLVAYTLLLTFTGCKASDDSNLNALPSDLSEASRAKLADILNRAGKTVTVFRIQSGPTGIENKSKELLKVTNSSVRWSGEYANGATLNVSFFTSEHLAHFAEVRDPSAVKVITFKISKETFQQQITDLLVPQRGAKGTVNPKWVDPTMPGLPVELPPEAANRLVGSAIPWSAKEEKWNDFITRTKICPGAGLGLAEVGSFALSGCQASAKEPSHDAKMRKDVKDAVIEYKKSASARDAQAAGKQLKVLARGLRAAAGLGRAAGAVAGPAAAAVSLGLGIKDAVDVARDGGTPADITAALTDGTIVGAIAAVESCKQKRCSPSEQFAAFLGGLFGIPTVTGPADVPLNDWEYKMIVNCSAADIEDGSMTRNMIGKVCWKSPNLATETCEMGVVYNEASITYMEGGSSFEQAVWNQPSMRMLKNQYDLVGSPNCFSDPGGSPLYTNYPRWN